MTQIELIKRIQRLVPLTWEGREKHAFEKINLLVADFEKTLSDRSLFIDGMTFDVRDHRLYVNKTPWLAVTRDLKRKAIPHFSKLAEEKVPLRAAVRRSQASR